MTTKTKQEARDGEWKGGPWSDITGKQKGLVGLSLRNLNRSPEGLRKGISIQEEASGK